jgi:hypothetical protein
MRLPAPPSVGTGPVGREFGMRIPKFKIIKTGYSKAQSEKKYDLRCIDKENRVNQRENFTSI